MLGEQGSKERAQQESEEPHSNVDEAVVLVLALFNALVEHILVVEAEAVFEDYFADAVEIYRYEEGVQTDPNNAQNR